MCAWWGRFHPPTLDVASVKLLRVVLLPDEGFPTRPINGSRPMMKKRRMCREVVVPLVWELWLLEIAKSGEFWRGSFDAKNSETTACRTAWSGYLPRLAQSSIIERELHFQNH